MTTPMDTPSSHSRPTASTKARPPTGDGPTLRPHRWSPIFSSTDRRPVGAECIVGPQTASADRLSNTPTFPPCRHALADAMRLADDFLRAGCPLPLSVRLSVDALDASELMPMLETWSLDHGGAHRLLGIEIDVRAWDLRVPATSRRIAALGYEVTLGGATTIDPAIARCGAKRFSITGSLVRGADVDDVRAATLRTLVEAVRAEGLVPAFKGVVDPDRSTCLRSATSHGHWQFDTDLVSLSEKDLRTLARNLSAHRYGSPMAEATEREEDLTWVEAVPEPLAVRSRPAGDGAAADRIFAERFHHRPCEDSPRSHRAGR